MFSQIYLPIPDDDELNDGNVHDQTQLEKQNIGSGHGWRRVSGRSVFSLAMTLLLLSFSLNMYLSYRLHVGSHESAKGVPTRYAHLRQDHEEEISPESDFESTNRSLQDAAWDSPRVDPQRLFVALEEPYTVAEDLPHSMRWPWDSKKGVYILNAAHELHCVKLVRTFVNEMHDRVPESGLTWTYPHTMHCLNKVREAVMCNADDMPLYTGRLHANAHSKTSVSGRGMKHMCRDWDALMRWADDRSACYHCTNEMVRREDFTETDCYKACPDGTQPWEAL